MTRQFVVTDTIRQTEIPILLNSWVTKTHSVKMLFKKNKGLSLYLSKNLTCLRVVLLRVVQDFLSHVKLNIGGLGQIAISRAISSKTALHIEPMYPLIL